MTRPKPTELSITIEDAEQMIKDTFKAVDAVKLVADIKSQAFKDAEEFIPTAIERINNDIKRNASHGYTFMFFKPTYGFKHGGGELEVVRKSIFETVKKDFENRGFRIEDDMIYWTNKEPEKRADEILR